MLALPIGGGGLRPPAPPAFFVGPPPSLAASPRKVGAICCYPLNAITVLIAQGINNASNNIHSNNEPDQSLPTYCNKQTHDDLLSHATLLVCRLFSNDYRLAIVV